MEKKFGYDKQGHPEGNRLRRTMNGWSNTSEKGRKLVTHELNGALVAVSQYQSTICSLKKDQFEYLLRLINDEPLPQVLEDTEDLIRDATHLVNASLLETSGGRYTSGPISHLKKLWGGLYSKHSIMMVACQAGPCSAPPYSGFFQILNKVALT